MKNLFLLFLIYFIQNDDSYFHLSSCKIPSFKITTSSCVELFHIQIWMLAPYEIKYMVFTYFLLFHWLFIHSIDDFLCYASFWFNIVLLLIFAIVAYAFLCHTKNSLPKLMSKHFLYVFISLTLDVPLLTFYFTWVDFWVQQFSWGIPKETSSEVIPHLSFIRCVCQYRISLSPSPTSACEHRDSCNYQVFSVSHTNQQVLQCSTNTVHCTLGPHIHQQKLQPTWSDPQ